jgi:hypothetical protein
MNPDHLHLVLNQATSQLDRRRGAPAPERVAVDGRSLAELLAFAAEYGALINFYDLADRVDGDWTVFFASDPTIALALLACLDLPRIGADLRRLLAEIRAMEGSSRRLRALRRPIGAGMRLVRILDNAHGAADGHFGRLLRREIQGGLAARLQRFAAHLAAGPDHGVPLDLAGLSAVWGLVLVPGAGPALIARTRGWVNLLIGLFEDLVELLLAVLHRLRDAAAQLLEASLQSEGHAPQSALYVAFAVLFRYAQATVNRFPRKLVDFYYDTILRQDSRAAVPDQLYLTFTPDQDVAEAAVPKATLFPAGTDAAGATIGYAAERALPVYAAAVASLSTLRVADAALMQDAQGLPVGDVVPALVLGGRADLANPAPFPPFGAPEAGTSGALTSVPATLGFAVSSPTLMLAGGERTVHLLMTPSADSLDQMMPALTAIGAEAGGMAPLDVLAALLQDGFALTYSTAAGWATIDGYAVLPPADDSTVFDLSFTLKVGADPMATGPGWTAPAIRAALLQQRVTIGQGTATAAVYPYAVLTDLALSALAIEVAVDDLDDLVLSTPNGAVDPSKPYALFGSPPVQYGGIEITAPELFAKRLDRLTLALDWYGLPRTATGFEGYYQGYVVDLEGKTVLPGAPPLFDNTTFLTTIDVVDPGLWTIAPPKDDAPVYLFRTAIDDPVPVADIPVLDATGFDALVVEPATPPAYYDPSLSAIRLALAAPSYAFGDTLYARNVMAALQEMPLAAACAEQCAATCKSSAEVAALAPALEPIARANTDAPDGQYREAIAEAVAKVLPQLTGTALKAVNDGLDKLGQTLPADDLAKVRAGLRAALAAVPSNGGGVLSRLSGWFNRAEPDAADVAQNLRTWLDGAGATLGRATTADFARARTVLDAADRIVAAATDGETQPPAVARPQMAAAVLAAGETLVNTHAEDMQACLKACMGTQPTRLYPNAPWLPMVSRLRLDYGARSDLPDVAGDGNTFWHLLPGDRCVPVAWPAGDTVPLLAPQPLQGALFIELTAAAAQPTLLFQMTVGPAGWSSDPPPITWAQGSAAGWLPLVPPDGLQGDGTNSLQNSGIVTLGLAAAPDGPVVLRVGVAAGADGFPLLGGVATNALVAGWVGPGGAETLDTPVPAGTITTSDPPLDGIATIDQPLPSFGGRSKAVGPAFQMWMAERLRHKDRAIQGWDYARLALADFPALWQLGVIPADKRTAGQVRLIAVAGPATPGVTDPTVPLADPQMLGEIGALFEPRISKFAVLEIDNPPYLRVTVKAMLEFSDTDTVAAWIARLNAELVAWLSPWPDPALGPRPADYYTTFAVGEFVRHRPYVRAILSLTLDCPVTDGWCYLTSALQHDLQGELVPAS